MKIKPHHRFSASYSLTPELVSSFARLAGDENPIHHNPDFAAKTRFGRLIASGTHTTSLLLGLTATHFSNDMSMLGLDYWIGFKRPVYADETILVEWLVIKVTPKKKLGGSIIELRGRILGQDGKTSIGAKGRLLITENL